MAYDPSTTIGKVRFRIADTLESPNQQISDAEINSVLDDVDDSIPRAAAVCLRAIAADRAKIAIRIKALDLEADYGKVAAELRALAKDLELSDEQDGYFDIAEMVTTKYARAEKIDNELERQG